MGFGFPEGKAWLCDNRDLIHVLTFKDDGQSIAIYKVKIVIFDRHKDKTIEGDGWNQNSLSL